MMKPNSIHEPGRGRTRLTAAIFYLVAGGFGLGLAGCDFQAANQQKTAEAEAEAKAAQAEAKTAALKDELEAANRQKAEAEAAAQQARAAAEKAAADAKKAAEEAQAAHAALTVEEVVAKHTEASKAFEKELRENIKKAELAEYRAEEVTVAEAGKSYRAEIEMTWRVPPVEGGADADAAPEEGRTVKIQGAAKADETGEWKFPALDTIRQALDQAVLELAEAETSTAPATPAETPITDAAASPAADAAPGADPGPGSPVVRGAGTRSGGTPPGGGSPGSGAALPMTVPAESPAVTGSGTANPGDPAAAGAGSVGAPGSDKYGPVGAEPGVGPGGAPATGGRDGDLPFSAQPGGPPTTAPSGATVINAEDARAAISGKAGSNGELPFKVDGVTPEQRKLPTPGTDVPAIPAPGPGPGADPGQTPGAEMKEGDSPGEGEKGSATPPDASAPRAGGGMVPPSAINKTPSADGEAPETSAEPTGPATTQGKNRFPSVNQGNVPVIRLPEVGE